MSTEMLGVLIGALGVVSGPVSYVLMSRRARLRLLQQQMRELRRVLLRLANEEVLKLGSEDHQRLREQAETLHDLSQQLPRVPRKYRREIRDHVLNRLDRIVQSAVVSDPHKDERAWLDAVSLQQRESSELLPVVDRCLATMRRSLRPA